MRIDFCAFWILAFGQDWFVRPLKISYLMKWQVESHVRFFLSVHGFFYVRNKITD
jgi:hypothetical protein